MFKKKPLKKYLKQSNALDNYPDTFRVFIEVDIMLDQHETAWLLQILDCHQYELLPAFHKYVQVKRIK